jgi:hypothetical protein
MQLIQLKSRAKKTGQAYLAGAISVILNMVLIAAAHAQAKVETITGYLIDRSCAAMIKHDHLDPMQRLKSHTKKCNLEPSCCEAGYTLYSGGKWIDLDAPSSEMAKKVIQSSKGDKGLMCKVQGSFKRDEFHASSVSEVNQ